MSRPLLSVAFVSTAFGLLVLCVPKSGAFDSYSIDDNDTNCRACHGDFRSGNYISLTDGQNWGNLHNLHRQVMLGGDCTTCHFEPGSTPVMIGESGGGQGFEPISCVGCHGRNEDMGHDNRSPGRGAGLRQHHVKAGVDLCMACHDDADPELYTPVGEDVPPSYYFTPDPNHPNKPTDPCSPNGEEDYAGTAEGLDNDSDQLYDGADPDCGSQCVPAPDGDMNFNGVTDFDDLLIVLSNFGTTGPNGDGDCDGDVDFDDLLLVLSGWD